MTLKEMQNVELEILKVFLNICEKHNFKYFMLGGTLLGAIRHKGFIPWDDDIDVGMPRSDYDKFLKIAEKEIPLNYGIKTFENSEHFIKYHSRLENHNYEFISSSYKIPQKMYAWIDIFPLDGMPNNKIAINLHKFHLLYLRAKAQLAQFDETLDLSNKKRPLHERIIIWAGKYLKYGRNKNPLEAMRRLDKSLRKYPYDNSNYLVNFMGAYKFKEMFNKEKYGEGVLYDFEDVKLCGPVDYDYVLKQLYGDYMIPPAEADKNRHNTEIVTK